MSDNILERVKKLVCEKLRCNESEVVESASFTEDLNADSLDVVELIMSVEEEFGIEVPDEDANSIKTVGDLVNYIKSKSS